MATAFNDPRAFPAGCGAAMADGYHKNGREAKHWGRVAGDLAAQILGRGPAGLLPTVVLAIPIINMMLARHQG